MKAVPHSDPLEIEVADFGPIVHGKVDLRPLTVFVGPSNTGKSYLAILVYALHRCFSAGAWPGHWRFSRGPHMFRNERRRQLPRKTLNALAVLAQQGLTGEKKSPVGRSIALSGPVADEIRSMFDAQGDQLDNEISGCFGIGGTEGLIRKGNNDCARIVFRRPFSDNSTPEEHLLTIGKQETRLGQRSLKMLRYKSTLDGVVGTSTICVRPPRIWFQPPTRETRRETFMLGN